MADTKIPNTCTVCHHLMQQVTSWRGESEIVNHLFSTFIFFFSPSAKKKTKGDTERAGGGECLCRYARCLFLLRGHRVQINTLSAACLCEMRVGGAVARPPASGAYLSPVLHNCTETLQLHHDIQHPDLSG